MKHCALFAFLALGALSACGDRGHYTLRDRATRSEGGESTASASTPETAASAETTGTEGAETEGAETEGNGAETTGTESAGTSSSTGTASATGTGVVAQSGQATASPPAARAPVPSSPVTITVRTTSGPVSTAIARHALSTQRGAIDQCYRRVLGPSGTGSIRASLTVEASGSTRADLETMTPALDRALPCVDTALERTRFPASSDGRPTHVVAEISRTVP